MINALHNQRVNKVSIFSTLISSNWGKLFFLAVSTSYLYVFMEWLFIITKPSFMDAVSLFKKFEILLISSLTVSVILFPFILFLFCLSRFPGKLRHNRVFLWLGGIIPALLLAGMMLLLLDNFTYTVFKTGIVTSVGLRRGLYGGVLVALFINFYRWVLPQIGTGSKNSFNDFQQKSLVWINGILLAVSLGIMLFRVDWGLAVAAASSTRQITNRPNVLLIGSDGMSADNMSVYGYDRETTPILKEFSKESLFMENAFPNASNTSGSLISILTGKLPVETRVIYTPDILRGNDAYQHLPGILRAQGYHTVEISAPEYADAYALNLQDGFDVANQRSLDEGQVFQVMRKLRMDDVSYFLSTLTERIADRVLHIFFIRQMPDPFNEVTEPAVKVKEQAKVDQLLDLFANADQPLFVHVHLMGTHGTKFSPQNRIFSKDQSQKKTWMIDFYDDAIHDFDAYMGRIVDQLSETGKLDNTIIIIYSDHAMRFQAAKRVPLIIRFPHGEFAGRIKNNAQNLDIAPTVLDYLNLDIPSWMEGQSLLKGEPDPYRLIFSAGVNSEMVDDGEIVTAKIEPPFYQFGSFNVIVCQNWVRFSDANMKWSSGEVPVHSAPCAGNDFPDEKIMQKGLINILQAAGFDTQTIKNTISAP